MQRAEVGGKEEPKREMKLVSPGERRCGWRKQRDEDTQDTGH